MLLSILEPATIKPCEHCEQHHEAVDLSGFDDSLPCEYRVNFIIAKAEKILSTVQFTPYRPDANRLLHSLLLIVMPFSFT